MASHFLLSVFLLSVWLAEAVHMCGDGTNSCTDCIKRVVLCCVIYVCHMYIHVQIAGVIKSHQECSFVKTVHCTAQKKQVQMNKNHADSDW